MDTPQPFQVMREDDNGNEFEVGRYATFDEAQAVADMFRARGHKQIYWVTPERDEAAPDGYQLAETT